LRPANDIKSVLGVENKLGQVDQEWRTGLAMYRQNHFTEALKHFDAVLNLSAGHLLAQEYKAKAQQNMGQDVPLTQETVAATETTSVTVTTTSESINKVAEKVGTGIGIMIIVLAIVLPIVIIIIVVVVIVIVVRKKNRPQVPPTATYTTPPQVPPAAEKPQVKAKFCPSCGGQVLEGATFCPNCGSKLG
jgi:acyl-CoA synthetase (AMP-forming)/AMP-acid ligase II